MRDFGGDDETSVFNFKKEKINSGYKHNNKVSAHGIFNLTFRMQQHTSSEETVTD